MTLLKKTTFRTMTAHLLEVYEAISLVDDGKTQYKLFANLLAKALSSSFKHVETVEKDQFSDLNFPCNTAYYFKFFNDNDIEVSFIVSYISFEDFLTLLGKLKLFIKSGNNTVLFVTEENTIATVTRELLKPNEIDEKKTTQSYYKISPPSPPTLEPFMTIPDDQGLYDALILEGTISGTEDFSIVEDFFARPPETFSHFIRSIIINFHIHYNGLKSIHICKSCGKIFLPERSGDERGIFCTDICKKNHYKLGNKHLTNCIQNQKRRIQTLKDNVFEDEKTQGLIRSIKIPSIDSDCRKCKTIKLAIENNNTVKAGNCPVLLNDESFVLLFEEYRKAKDAKKLNKKKGKNLSGALEEHETPNGFN